MKKCLFMLFLVMGLVGCASMDKGRQVKLHGLIMDSDGNGVASYKVMKKDKVVGYSNDSGYFDLDAVYGEGVDFILGKNNWETVRFSEENSDFNKLYVFKVRDVDSICSEIEGKLDSRDFEGIERILDSLDDEFNNNPRIKYLKAVTFYKQGKTGDALMLLADECFLDFNEEYVKDFVELIEKVQGGNNG
ncbi:MAG: hypothetical protein IKQ43_00140 [Treponema sp.]|nr:hypothetical protein [Treponema sp.]